jgi:hypothetical protein
MKDLTIIQYNCNNANQGAVRALFDSFSPQKHQILAIQEPGFNKLTNSTYCPRGYTLSFDPCPTTKVCFMTSQDIDQTSWQRRQYGPYVMALWIKLPTTHLTVINVYNPRDNGPRIQTWPRIAQALDEAPKDGEIALLGDFNAHHPSWGGLAVATEQQAEHLIQATRDQELQLATPPGEPTWKRGQQESVIDLTFISQQLYNRAIHCGPEPSWAIIPDHIPIRISLDITAYPQPPSKRYAIHRLDLEGLSQLVQDTPWDKAQEPLEALQELLATALPDYCPYTRPSPYAARRWSPQAAALLTESRKAQYSYQQHGRIHDHQRSTSLARTLKKELQRVARNNWRQFIDESTKNLATKGKGLWKLA